MNAIDFSCHDVYQDFKAKYAEQTATALKGYRGKIEKAEAEFITVNMLLLNDNSIEKFGSIENIFKMIYNNNEKAPIYYTWDLMHYALNERHRFISNVLDKNPYEYSYNDSVLDTLRKHVANYILKEV